MELKKIFQTRTKNFWLFETSTSLFFIGASITSIFIPIILLKLGFEVQEVILYYILFHFLDVIFNFAAKYFLEKIGPKKLFILGTIFIIIFYNIYAFLLKGVDWDILILMATFAALFDSFFYNAYYYLIFESTEKLENVKANNIIINTMANLAYFSGPLIGAGIILLTENDKWLFYTSLTFFGFSLIPLFFYKINHKIEKRKIDFKNFFSDIKNKKNFLTLGFYKISQEAENVIFPISIFLVFRELDNIAYISIISTIAIFLTTFISGSVKKAHREKIIIFGAAVLILIWLGRIFIQNEFWLYLSVALSQIFLIFIFMPLDTNIFRHGEETSKPVLTAFYKNTLSMFSKMLFYIFVFGILYFTEIKDTFWLVIFALVLIILTNLIYLNWKKKN